MSSPAAPGLIAFLDITITKAKALVEKMVSNLGWCEE